MAEDQLSWPPFLSPPPPPPRYTHLQSHQNVIHYIIVLTDNRFQNKLLPQAMSFLEVQPSKTMSKIPLKIFHCIFLSHTILSFKVQLYKTVSKICLSKLHKRKKRKIPGNVFFRSATIKTNVQNLLIDFTQPFYSQAISASGTKVLTVLLFFPSDISFGIV